MTLGYLYKSDRFNRQERKGTQRIRIATEGTEKKIINRTTEQPGNDKG
jgi:hypothetical protein